MKWGILGIAGVGFLSACHSAETSNAAPTQAWTTGRSVSRETRILSVLHAKNQDEIDAGNLAIQRGQDSAVRRYGEMLVRDHRGSDDRVRQTAANLNISLMSPSETNVMLAREQGLERAPAGPAEELGSLQASSFDAAFAGKKLEDHRELIAMVERERAKVGDQRVRDLLEQVLPVLREHERKAADLAGETTGAPGAPGS